MRKLRLLPVVCLTLIFLCSSCISKKKWTELVNDKEQLDMMLSKTQEQVKTLEGDVATLDEEKTKLEEEFTNETNRLNDKIGSIKNDLEVAKKETTEMKEMISEKDAKINELAEAVNSSFAPFTAKGLSLEANEGSVYIDQPVHFKSGSARLTEDSKAAIQAIVDALMADADAKLVVEGHTDDVPMKEDATWSSNKQLSLARANAVVRTMVKMGVNPVQLMAVGHGSSKPAMDYENAEDKEAAREHNRRAEFSIVTNAAAELFRAAQSL